MYIRELLGSKDRLYHLLTLRKHQWKKDWQTHQLQRLKAIVRHAYTYVPYYHRLFKSVKFKPDDLRGLEDLQRIPITSKSDVRKSFSEIMITGTEQLKYRPRFTSGSTGIPMKFLYDSKTKVYEDKTIEY